MFAVAMTGAAVFAGVAGADVDARNSIVDGLGNNVTVMQSDTVIQGVAPLDGSPLTREWTHGGVASVQVAGAHAADFEGTVSAGYQFAYPMSVGGSVSVSYSSPDASVALGDPIELSGTVTTPDATFSASLTPGPGIAEVEVVNQSAAGEVTEIRFANVRGTATGVLGAVTVRPYVKVVSNDGSSVTSYGSSSVVG